MNNKEQQYKKRDINLDLIRCIAVLSVISVHFFLNNGFYKEIVQGERMYFMTIMRTGLMVCVPLFLLLTGYLMSQKTLSRKYYLGIIKTLGIYILASIACVLVNVFYQQQEISLKQAILSIFSFSGAKYSWYVEMYIGLFLLIPFLNLIIQGLTSKRQMQVLIGTLLVLTALPSVMNIYDFMTPGYFKDPSLSKTYQALVPDWWKNLYPLTYYFIGAYIRKYNVQMNKVKNVVLLIAVVFCSGLFNCYRSHNMVFQKGEFVQWQSIQNVLSSVLLFIWIKNINISRWPHVMKAVIVKISEISLGTYLVSSIFDSIFYQGLCDKVPMMTDRLNYFIVIVPAVFICSFILALILESIYAGLYKGVIAFKGKYI